MSTDLTFWENSVPVAGTLYKLFVAIGWGMLIGNCIFQSLKAMFAGLGFETESPAILLFRTALFGTLLVFSKDICDIGLSIGKNVMMLIGIPNSVTITTPDESVFGGTGAGWLLVIIIGFILGFQLIKLFFEIAERYVVVAVLTLLCPVGLSMGGSKSTKDICTGFIRTYASMIVMMVMNVLFLKLILSALATMPPDTLVIPWCLLVVGIAKTARKADNLISKIGLNPAITGDPLGRGRGTMMAIMAARTIMYSASRSSKARNVGNGSSASSKTYSNTRSMTGGTNVHNGGASSSHSEKRSSSASSNFNTKSQNLQNMKNNQSSSFGASNSTVSVQSKASSRFGSVNHNSTSSTGTMSSGNVHFSGNGNTRVNTNRFGSQSSTKVGNVRSTPTGNKIPISGKTASGAKITAKSPTFNTGKTSVHPVKTVAPKSVRFGTSPVQKNSVSGGLRQNINPFKVERSTHFSGLPRTSAPQTQINCDSKQSIDSAKDGDKNV